MDIKRYSAVGRILRLALQDHHKFENDTDSSLNEKNQEEVIHSYPQPFSDENGQKQ